MKLISIFLSAVIILISVIPASAAIESANTAASAETEISETYDSDNTESSENIQDTIQSDTAETAPASLTENTENTESTEPPADKGQTFSIPEITKIENTDKGVRITWNFQIGVFKYRIFIKSGKGWKRIGLTSANQFIHTSAVPGNTYIYTVRTVDKDDSYTSLYSKTGWKHTCYLPTPQLKSADYSDKGIDIKWNKVNNAKIYRVFYKSSKVKSWTKLVDTESTKYTATSLSNNVKYIFTVRCLNPSKGKWESDYDHKGLTVIYHTKPVLTDISGTASGVKINWKAVTGVKYYKVYYKDNNSAWKLITKTPVTGTSYTFKTTAYRHKITLTVKCAEKDGRLLSFHQRPGLSIEYLKTPVITSVTGDVSDMTIKWNKIDGVYKYRVFYHNGKTWKAIGNTASTKFTYSDGYCDGYKDKEGGLYRFTVRCFNKYGEYVSGFKSPGYEFKYTFVPKVLKKQIKVPYFSQTEMRAGCETYATTMLLHFYGFKISPVDFASEFVIQRQPYWDSSGNMYGPSMDSAMCGNVYNGWGINARGMAKCINTYLKDRKSKLRATAYTDKSLQYLCNKYVANGIPVLVWSTSQLTPTYVESRWTVNYTSGDDNKKKEEWYHGEHCLVLIGYDFPNRRYIYNDSLAKDRSVGVSNWAKVRSEDRFTTLGSNSIVIQ